MSGLDVLEECPHHSSEWCMISHHCVRNLKEIMKQLTQPSEVLTKRDFSCTVIEKRFVALLKNLRSKFFRMHLDEKCKRR